MPKSKIDRLRGKDYFGQGESLAILNFDQADVSMHGHEFAELVLILSGHAVHVTGDVRHKVEAGHVLFINPSRSHAYEKTHRFQLANILVREEVFQGAEKELGSLPGYHALFTLESMRWRSREFTSHLRLSQADFRQVLRWLEALREETQKPNDGGRLLSRCWLMLIIGLLARSYSRDAENSSQLEMRLGRVLSWIDTNFRQPMRIGELAERAAMSERTFLRRFREATGISPSEYLIRARIRHAMTLLEQGERDGSITGVAYQSGYEDSNYFARQFRKLTGKSPREYAMEKRPSRPGAL